MHPKPPTRGGRYGRRAVNRSLFLVLGLLGATYWLRQRRLERR